MYYKAKHTVRIVNNVIGVSIRRRVRNDINAQELIEVNKLGIYIL